MSGKDGCVGVWASTWYYWSMEFENGIIRFVWPVL